MTDALRLIAARSVIERALPGLRLRYGATARDGRDCGLSCDRCRQPGYWPHRPDCSGVALLRDAEEVMSTAHTAPLPPDWHAHHSEDCGTAYRGCAPDCPKDRYERTGVWAPAKETT